MVGVSVSLPVWRERIRAAEAEADAEMAAAEARREAAVDAVRAEVAQAADLLAEMSHVVELYESRLLPAARDQLRAGRTGFESGQVDFISVVEAERNLRSVELGYEEARTDRHRRLAALERAVGVEPIPAEGGRAAAANSSDGPAANAAGGTR
jgi:outer membrane protein TolC